MIKGSRTVIIAKDRSDIKRHSDDFPKHLCGVSIKLASKHTSI